MLHFMLSIKQNNTKNIFVINGQDTISIYLYFHINKKLNN